MVGRRLYGAEPEACLLGYVKNGDFDAMEPQLELYNSRLLVAKARTRYYFGHDGAYFYEHPNLFGVCVGAEYGWNRSEQTTKGLEDNAWVRLHFSTGLEFALMMLEHARYAGQSIDKYLDFVVSVVEFYFNFYRLDENSILCIFPSTALETYKGVMISKSNPKKDMFKIDLLNMLQK